MSYQEVPVDSARSIANTFAKDVVVIVAWDEVSNSIHVTTYGRSARFKTAAANLGEILAKAAGLADPIKTYEDFRFKAQAEWAEERDALLARIKKLEEGQ